jgi:transcriptional regulator with XRE-family HTH domain
MPAQSRRLGATKGTVEGSVIGSRVRAARDRRGWSREALAHLTDLSWSAIEQIESGRRRNTRPGTLRALSKALGVTIDYLVGESNPTKMLDHRVLVYDEDERFLDAAIPFLRVGLERSEALLAVAAEKNIGILTDQLGEDSAEVVFVDAEDGYKSPLTAIAAYRAFLDDALGKGAPWVRMIGEPRWASAGLWNQYESLFNVTFGTMPATVLCLYDERAVDPAIVSSARLTHPQIVEGREVINNPMYLDPSDFLLRDEQSSHNMD